MYICICINEFGGTVANCKETCKPAALKLKFSPKKQGWNNKLTWSVEETVLNIKFHKLRQIVLSS